MRDGEMIEYGYGFDVKIVISSLRDFGVGGWIMNHGLKPVATKILSLRDCGVDVEHR
jgi:hypothetical protein